MINITRRSFIRYTLAGLVSSPFIYPAWELEAKTGQDEQIFLDKIKLAKNRGLFNKPINEIIIEIGKSFINTPYTGNTLDSTGKEVLVTNLHGLDCWTFFENTLVISRVIRKGNTSFENYKKELGFIRYRNGFRNGYASRLHYFIDWIYDNVQKGIVKDINKDTGGVRLNKKIDFMTAHRDLYPPLSSDDCYNKIKEIEKNINSRAYYYIKTQDLPKIEDKLKNGDIIGIISTRENLDASHTGLIYKQNGISHILDAASSVGYVDISKETLYEYLKGDGIPGIIAARPL